MNGDTISTTVTGTCVSYTYIGNRLNIISPDDPSHVVRVQDIRVLLDINLFICVQQRVDKRCLW